MGCVGLLFDECLPAGLARAFDAVGPRSQSIHDLGLKSLLDESVLKYCIMHRLALVTRDTALPSEEVAKLGPAVLGTLTVLAARAGNMQGEQLIALFFRHYQAIAGLLERKPGIYELSPTKGIYRLRSYTASRLAP